MSAQIKVIGLANIISTPSAVYVMNDDGEWVKATAYVMSAAGVWHEAE